MILLRNIAFAIFCYGLSIPIILFVPVAGLFGQAALRRYCDGWAGLIAWATRWILGIRIRVEGEVPAAQVFYAAKHQSNVEAVELTRMLSLAPVMKRELTKIPLWGWAAQRYGGIVADREANAGALRSMMKDAKARLAEGRSVLIFPEGTRTEPGEAPELRSGFAGLYRILGLPVVPVALDSGHVWPKRGLMRPGVITFRFCAPIPPGLPRAEIEARVHKAINALN